MIAASSQGAPSTHTLQPVRPPRLSRSFPRPLVRPLRGAPTRSPRCPRQVVTGSSVLGVKCSDGVVLASDTLGSYGSMARYRDLRRMVQVTDELVIGAGGEYSDFQAIIEMLEEITCGRKLRRPSLPPPPPSPSPASAHDGSRAAVRAGWRTRWRMTAARCPRRPATSSCRASCTTGARRATRSGTRWCWAASGTAKGARPRP
jgi:hypothetical protein